MLNPRGKSLRSRPSFAGTGLLERMRSTTFALLGIMAAMGLGLVALISSQGLPVLPGLPAPGFSSEQSRVDDARAIAAPSPTLNLSPADEAPVAQRATSGGGTQTDRSDSSGLAGSRQLATAEIPVPADQAPSGTPSEEVPVAPAPAAPPASEPPAATSPTESAPEVPAVASTPPGKATAVVDPTGDDEEESERARADEAAENRSSRGGRGSGKSVPAPVPVPPPAQDDARGAADVAVPPPSPADLSEDGRGGRGHDSRRSRR